MKKNQTTKNNRQMMDEYLKLLTSNSRSAGTLKNVDYVLGKLDKFLDKSFPQATEKDLQAFFNTIPSYSTRNINGVIIIKFYNWLFKLDKKERPANMRWFEYVSKDKMEKEADPDGIKTQFITPEEYQTIITYKPDTCGVYHALWESFYISGGRLGEVASMKVGDVRIEGNHVSIVLHISKTKPRVVPLSETPHALLRWLGNHPHRDDKEAPLWINMGYKNHGQPISRTTIQNQFWQIRQNTNIKKTLSVHCFRKTRATIMFNQRSKDGGLMYNDTHMAKFFGWKATTVVDRRQQYDLTTEKDLQDLVFSKLQTTIPAYDALKQEKQLLENAYQQKMDELQSQMDKMAEMMENLAKREAYNDYKNQL